VFVERGYNVVANSRHIAKSAVEPAERLAVVEGSIGQASTAAEIAATAMSKFGSIDGVVNNAGIFFSKPCWRKKTGGGVACVTSAMVEHSSQG
jgi:NAD(P)-dependent dehydrogenase (short-subunit alcohol dehydrogenase family)